MSSQLVVNDAHVVAAQPRQQVLAAVGARVGHAEVDKQRAKRGERAPHVRSSAGPLEGRDARGERVPQEPDGGALLLINH